MHGFVGSWDLPSCFGKNTKDKDNTKSERLGKLNVTLWSTSQSHKRKNKLEKEKLITWSINQR